MPRDIFGSTDQSHGAKVPTHTEWNGINNAITNIEIGGRFASRADASFDGITIPSDSFFFTHVAFIADNYTDGVIGVEREEEWLSLIHI
jgi:hypothetical protein